MAETQPLPMLPLDDVVVLPGMVVPVPMSDSEARAAVEAAQATAGVRQRACQAQVLLVPRLDGKYSGFGAIGVIEQVGRLRGGEHAAVVRGTPRARIGTGTTGPGRGALGRGDGAGRTAGDPRELRELAREYKSIAITILQQRGAFQFIDTVQSMTDPAALADLAGYAGYLSNEQKVWLLETTDVAERLRTLVTWSREHLAELDVAETIRKDVQEGMDKQQREFLLRQQLAAVRKELAELNGTVASEEQDYRARVEAADLPEKVRTAALAEVDKLERTSDQSPGGGLDPHLAGHRPGAAVEHPHRGRLPDRRGAGGARRRPRRAWTTSRSGSSSTWRCAGGARTGGSA